MGTVRTLFVSAGLVGLVLLPACKQDRKKPAATDTAVADPARDPGSAATAPGAGAGMSGTAEPGGAASDASDMANCPSAVESAETVVALTKGAVVVTITSKDKGKAAEIQGRAKHLDRVEAATEGKPTGDGTGAGRTRCPVAMEPGVSLAIEEREDGVKVVLSTADPSRLAAVAKDAEARVAAMKAGGGSDAEGDDAGEDDEPAEEP